MVAQPVVRQMVGSIWTPDPTIVQARHMQGSVWTLDALPLPTVKGSAAMLALINANVITPFTTSTLTIGAPAVATSHTSVCNTQIQITAQPASGYSGSMLLYYNRRQVSAAFASTQWLLGTIAANTTILNLLNAINTAYGTALDPTDVVDGPVLAGVTNLTLTIASTSYVFLPGSTLQLVNSVSLAAATPITQLGGFDNAAGVGPTKNYTTALLHFDSPVGLTQITDDYGHPVTLASGVTLSTNAKFGSSSLAGTGASAVQYVSMPDSPDLRLAGDFTIEFWFYTNTLTQDCTPVCKGLTGAANQAWIEFLNGNIQVKPDGVTTAVAIAAAGSYVISTWTHFALTKQGTLWTAWINGVAVGSLTSAATFGNLAGPLSIQGSPTGNSSMNGLIDEFRYTNGLARYSANFVPQTAAHPMDVTAAMLLHLDSVTGKALVDATGTYSAVLTGNAALVTTGQKFGAGAVQMVNDTVSAISVPDAPGLRFLADFCIEMQFYPTSNAANGILAGKGAKALLWYAASNRLQLTLDGGTGAVINAAVTPALNTWHHVALTREGNVWRIWLDGAVVGSYTGAGTWGNVANNLYFGNGLDQAGWGVTNSGVTGLVDEVRVTNGWCRYSPTFVTQVAPYVKDNIGGTLANAFAGKTSFSAAWPTSGRSARALVKTIAAKTGINLTQSDVTYNPIAAGSNQITLTADPAGTTYTPGSQVTFTFLATAMLLHMDGANGATSAMDAITGNTLALTGGTLLSTAQAKFGTASLAPVSAGFATLPDHPNYHLLGDYTIEWNSYLNAVPTTSAGILTKSPGTVGAPVISYVNGGAVYVFDDSSATGNVGSQVLATGAGILKALVWQHVAVVVKSGIMSVYVDGVLQATTTVTGRTFGNNAVAAIIGNWYTTTYNVNGYLDEMRVSNVARYSANFTPPQRAFVATDVMTVLSSVFPNNPSVVVPAGVTTIKGLANTIAKTCGVNLTADDLVDGPVSGSSLTLTAANTSFVYVPGGQVTITLQQASANLLLHFDGVQGATTTTDDAGHPMTIVGGSLTTTNKKFGTTGYQGTATGYVSTPDASDLEMTGDFTMEGFWTPSAADLTGEAMFFAKGGGSFLDCYKNAWYTSLGETNVKIINGVAANLVAGQTYHVAYTRQGTLTTIWVNGVSVATGNSSLAWGVDTSPFLIGNYNAGNIGSTGQYDEVRVINGRALYTATFTPPQRAFVLPAQSIALSSVFSAATLPITPPSSATVISALVNQIASVAMVNLLPSDIVDGPVNAGATTVTLTAAATSLSYVPGSSVTLTLQAVGKTALLMHFDGTNGQSTTIDDIGHAAQMTGGATLSTTGSKFGTSALLPSAANAAYAYVSINDAAEFHMAADFTIEWFMQPMTASNDGMVFSKGKAYMRWYQGQLYFVSDAGGAQVIGFNPTWTVGTWHHVAVVKQSGVYNLYYDGVKVAGPVTSAATFGVSSSPMLIGGDAASDKSFATLIDEFRLSNVARYTAAFTPPTAAFVAD